MKIEAAECQIALPFNGSVKALLTWQASPLAPEGYCWLNCAREFGFAGYLLCPGGIAERAPGGLPAALADAAVRFDAGRDAQLAGAGMVRILAHQMFLP